MQELSVTEALRQAEASLANISESGDTPVASNVDSLRQIYDVLSVADDLDSTAVEVRDAIGSLLHRLPEEEKRLTILEEITVILEKYARDDDEGTRINACDLSEWRLSPDDPGFQSGLHDPICDLVEAYDECERLRSLCAKALHEKLKEITGKVIERDAAEHLLILAETGSPNLRDTLLMGNIREGYSRYACHMSTAARKECLAAVDSTLFGRYKELLMQIQEKIGARSYVHLDEFFECGVYDDVNMTHEVLAARIQKAGELEDEYGNQ